MPTVYASANTLDEISFSQLITDSNSIIDSQFFATAMNFNTVSDSCYVEQGYFGGLKTVWLHWWQSANNGWNGNAVFMRVYNPSGVNIFNVLQNTTTGQQCQYWNGSAFVSVGTGVLTAQNAYRFDLHLVINGVNSLIELYRNGILLQTATFDGSNAAVAAGVDHWRVRAIDSFAGNSGAAAEMLTVDSPTINYRYATSPPATLGSHQDWIGSGTIGNVSKTAINDNTFIQSGTVGDKTTYEPAARSAVQAGQTVLFTKIIVRGRLDSTGPQNVDGMFTIGGTDYFSSNTLLTFGFAGYGIIFPTNPATSAPWTPTAAGSALEFGVRSAT